MTRPAPERSIVHVPSLACPPPPHPSRRPRRSAALPSAMSMLVVAATLLIASFAARARADEDTSWPPALPGVAKPGEALRLEDARFLDIPESVKKALEAPASAAKAGKGNAAGDRPAEPARFTVARVPPIVDLVYHTNLPDRALNGTGWSAWGDICVASDGSVYVGTGDHGDDTGGKAHVYVYRYDPAKRFLTQIVNPNAVAGVGPGDPSWSKVHAGIKEGADKKIYFICTLNDGGRAGEVKWTQRIPGGQFFQYDPATNQTRIVGAIPGECTATTLLDAKRDLMYLCLEGKLIKPAASALAAFDLTNHKIVYTSPHDAIYANRALALDDKGRVYFNGKDGLWRYDPDKGDIAPTGVAFPGKATMRSATGISKDGYIYGTTMGPGLLFRYHPASNKLDMLGPDFLLGEYTTVSVLSPDERFVYYLPGAHGGAKDIGTPVVQYDVKTGTQKVLAFLRGPIEERTGYVAAGTYGVKISADGSTLYANLNGHAGDKIRPAKMPAHGFGLTSLVAIQIPKEER